MLAGTDRTYSPRPFRDHHAPIPRFRAPIPNKSMEPQDRSIDQDRSGTSRSSMEPEEPQDRAWNLNLKIEHGTSSAPIPNKSMEPQDRSAPQENLKIDRSEPQDPGTSRSEPQDPVWMSAYSPRPSIDDRASFQRFRTPVINKSMAPQDRTSRSIDPRSMGSTSGVHLKESEPNKEQEQGGLMPITTPSTQNKMRRSTETVSSENLVLRR